MAVNVKNQNLEAEMWLKVEELLEMQFPDYRSKIKNAFPRLPDKNLYYLSLVLLGLDGQTAATSPEHQSTERAAYSQQLQREVVAVRYC